MINDFKNTQWSEEQKTLCPEWLIESDPSLKAIVNPNRDDAQIYFNKLQLAKHCTKDHCHHRKSCTEDIREKLIAMFDTFDKDNKN